ncbi:MFS transporter [Actinomadura geliboluensis]|uniref:MFS transporter n=1 Tax=Actinomadura geliboluensis TaxID=882440 RepID=UPI0036D06E33
MVDAFGVGAGGLGGGTVVTGVLLGLSRLSEDGGITYACHRSRALRCSQPSSAGRHARASAAPIVDIRLLRLRSLGSASAALFAASDGMFLLPLYYQHLRDESVLQARLLLIPQRGGALVSRFVIGTLVDRFGARAVTIAGFLLAALATAPSPLAGPATNLGWLGTALFLHGLGIGAVLIPPCPSPTRTSSHPASRTPS